VLLFFPGLIFEFALPGSGDFRSNRFLLRDLGLGLFISNYGADCVGKD
jgi:hypothetical protein